jgi:hypothetical protein
MSSCWPSCPVVACDLQVPRLTERHRAAIALFEELAASPEIAMHYVLQPGDIQLLNNHTCLHHRTAFVDHEVRERIPGAPGTLPLRLTNTKAFDKVELTGLLA